MVRDRLHEEDLFYVFNQDLSCSSTSSTGNNNNNDDDDDNGATKDQGLAMHPLGGGGGKGAGTNNKKTTKVTLSFKPGVVFEPSFKVVAYGDVDAAADDDDTTIGANQAVAFMPYFDKLRETMRKLVKAVEEVERDFRRRGLMHGDAMAFANPDAAREEDHAARAHHADDAAHGGDAEYNVPLSSGNPEEEEGAAAKVTAEEEVGNAADDARVKNKAQRCLLLFHRLRLSELMEDKLHVGRHPRALCNMLLGTGADDPGLIHALVMFAENRSTALETLDFEGAAKSPEEARRLRALARADTRR